MWRGWMDHPAVKVFDPLAFAGVNSVHTLRAERFTAAVALAAVVDIPGCCAVWRVEVDHPSRDRDPLGEAFGAQFP
jgi:hypothetical protein